MSITSDGDGCGDDLARLVRGEAKVGRINRQRVDALIKTHLQNCIQTHIFRTRRRRKRDNRRTDQIGYVCSPESVSNRIDQLIACYVAKRLADFYRDNIVVRKRFDRCNC